MRKLLCLGLVLALATPFAACGDDGSNPSSDIFVGDTTVPNDTDAAGDSSIVPDTTTRPDTGAPEDTTPIADTGISEDTAITEDTATAPDTAIPEDTTGTTDTAVADDTAAATDTTVVADTAGAGDTTVVADTAVASDTAVATDTTVVVTCTDDTLAGTAAVPVDLATVLTGNPTFTLCPGVADVFEINATAGEILKISMVIIGADPTNGTSPGEDDLDLYLYQGTTAPANRVGSSASADAVEQIIFTVPTTGPYFLVVEDYQGSSADYTLTFSRSAACAVDADCAGTDICYIGVDDASFALAQECQAYVAPACGQATAEDATSSSHSDSTAVDFSSVATDGSFTGVICGADLDVYAFSLNAGDSLIGTVNATVPDQSDLVVTLVGPGGAIIDFYEVVIDTPTVELAQYFVTEPGTYFLYLDYFAGAGATTDLAYTIEADVAAPCLLDADCGANRVCGKAIAQSGPALVCAPYQADPCGSDDDNSQTRATALTSGTPVSGAVCATGTDYYKFTLTGARSDVTAELTWTGGADLDAYLFAADGTPYGSGWYGANNETLSGSALPAGVYFLVVDLYDAGTGNGTVSYSVEVTTAAAAACTADAGCVVGGTYDDGDLADATVNLSCNLATGVCAPGVVVAPGSVDPGGACFDGAGVSHYGPCNTGGFCALGQCLTECAAQADCDADWGGSGVSYCLTDVFTIDLCLPSCDSPTATTHLWGDAECVGLFGVDSSCEAATHQCLVP